MDQVEFQRRTTGIGLRTLRLVRSLPKDWECQHIARQLFRSATSVGANHRAACRGRSASDVIAKLKIVEEEADESLHWMELLIEAGMVPRKRLAPLLQETDEVLAMVVASIKTLRKRAAPAARSGKSD